MLIPALSHLHPLKDFESSTLNIRATGTTSRRLRIPVSADGPRAFRDSSSAMCSSHNIARRTILYLCTFLPFSTSDRNEKNVPWYLANDCVVADELQTSLR